MIGGHLYNFEIVFLSVFKTSVIDLKPMSLTARVTVPKSHFALNVVT